MQPKTAKRLLDALEAGRRVMQFTEGTIFDDYAQSALLRSAVERQFEIIGESLGKAAAVDPLLSVPLRHER